MADTDLDITIDITGNTASIATDYSSSGITNAHVQIVKMAWGPANTTSRVTTSTPLPVDIRSLNTTFGVTGSVGGLGTFRITNGTGPSVIPIVVSGTTSGAYNPVKISGNIEGTTNGILVGITGTVILGNTYISVVGVSGGRPIAVTGGRPLSSSTDSVTVSGTVGVTGGRYISQSSDSIRIYGGQGGETMIPVTLRDGSGNAIASTAGALNVNLVGAGITATVTVSPLVGISQADRNTPLIVAGLSGGTPVRIHGLGTNDSVPVVLSGSNSVSVSGPVTVDQSEVLGRLDDIKLNTGNITDVKNTTTSIYNKLNSGDGINTKSVKPGTVYYGFLEVRPGGINEVIEDASRLNSGISIKAAASNGTRDVVISGNAAGGDGPDNGFPLSAGQTIFIETNSMQNVFFQNFSSPTPLKIHYIAS